MTLRHKETREQENEETRMQGKKRKSPRSSSTYSPVYSFNIEPERVETGYDRIPATNRRFRL